MKTLQAKFSSRKFWVSLAGLIAGLVALFTGNGEFTPTISGAVVAVGSVVAYILGEAKVDAARMGGELDED